MPFEDHKAFISSANNSKQMT